MHRRSVSTFASGGLLIGALLLVPGVVAASATSPVSIDIHGAFDQDHGTFAADSQVLCPTGTTTDSVRFNGNGPLLKIQDVKTFDCDDHSGTFTMLIQVQIHLCDAGDRFSWVVTGGTGDYAGLRGAGTGAGVYYPPNACEADGINDHLDGMLSVH